MATIYDLNITQGSQFDVRLTATDNEGATIDLSGYGARGYLKHRYSDTGKLLDLSPAVVSGDNGSACISGFVDIALLASQTVDLPVVQGVYDVEIYKGTHVNQITKGVANVFPEVTN
jgi:hypothetical protein